jgi:anti-sigma B factor antagonist
MQIAEYTRGPVTIVELVGEFDSLSAPESREELVRLASSGEPVLLDLTKTSYMSSAGLRVLLLIYRQAVGSGTPVALVGIPKLIHDVMAATGFIDFFSVTDTVDDGLDLLVGAQL